MQKTPTYIGIFCQNPKDSSKKVKEYCRDCLTELVQKHQNLDEQIYVDRNNLGQAFKFPQDNHHITHLFIGGNLNKLGQKQKEIYKTFKHGQKCMIKVKMFVYVPGTIMVGFCPENDGFEADNKHPHMTLMLGGNTKAVESNAVLDIVFSENPELLKEEFVFKQMKQMYKGKKILVVNKQVVFNGLSGDNFKLGRTK